MCGGFSCSRNTLIGLNIFYIFVSLLLIGVATTAKTSNLLTNLPIVGGIVACGVFLLFIAIVGLYGAFKHNQVTLFVYMVVLFTIFVIQFSVACACLAANPEDEMSAAEQAFNGSASLAVDVEKLFNCCGFDSVPANFTTICSTIPCAQGEKPSCDPCKPSIEDKIDGAFNASGGLGLFFAFTEIIGAVLAYRYRNLMDPKVLNRPPPTLDFE